LHDFVGFYFVNFFCFYLMKQKYRHAGGWKTRFLRCLIDEVLASYLSPIIIRKKDFC